MMCDSKELLVGYLYGELDPAEQRAFDAHLLTCGECRSEVPALQATRGRMAAWAPPEPDLEFRVIRGGASAPAAAPRSRSIPAWALAAAASLVLAASAGLANLEVRYGNDGVVVRTGWARSEAPQGTQAANVPVAASPVPASVDVAALEARLRELEGAMQRTEPAGVQTVGMSAGQASSDAELLRRVRQLIADAETRQQTDMTLRLAQVFKDFDRQRRADLAFIQQGLGQYQGVTNMEIAQQRDMLNQFIRVAGTRQEK